MLFVVVPFPIGCAFDVVVTYRNRCSFFFIFFARNGRRKRTSPSWRHNIGRKNKDQSSGTNKYVETLRKSISPKPLRKSLNFRQNYCFAQYGGRKNTSSSRRVTVKRKKRDQSSGTNKYVDIVRSRIPRKPLRTSQTSIYAISLLRFHTNTHTHTHTRACVLWMMSLYYIQ